MQPPFECYISWIMPAIPALSSGLVLDFKLVESGGWWWGWLEEEEATRTSKQLASTTSSICLLAKLPSVNYKGSGGGDSVMDKV